MGPDEHASRHENASAVPGRFIAVIGPSGVGKDSVMAGLVARHPTLFPVRRAITRPADAGGERHEPLSVEAFRQRESRGAFVLSWRAHGLRYGIPAVILPLIEAGRDVLANLSRGIVGEAAARFPRLEVLSLTADPHILTQRLTRRGRETPEDIAARLARDTRPLPPRLRVHDIANDGALAEAIDASSRALYPPS